MLSLTQMSPLELSTAMPVISVKVGTVKLPVVQVRLPG
jgi:hypothetical protein